MAEKLIVPDSVRAALDAFRSKDLSGRHFLVLAYEGKNTLRLEHTGAGFAGDSVAFLPDAECRYVYLRTEHQVEAALTTKYAWIDWTPSAIPPMRKALLSTHKGQVSDLLKPTHVTLQASQRDELADLDGVVMDLIGGASGTKSNITSKQAFQAPAVDISRSAAAKESTDFLPQSAKNARDISLRDEAAIRAAFKAVRSDADPTTWALLQFVADGKYETLELRATGTGGPGELRAALDAAQPNYALFRTTEQVDRTLAVRFSFLRVVPSTLPAGKKAHIGTLGGVVVDLFKPFAFDFDYSSVDDFSEAEVHDKISALSGVKNMSLTDNATGASAKIAHPRGATSSPSSSGAGPSSFLGQPTGTIALDEPLQAALRSLRTDARPGETQTRWLVAAKVARADALALVAQGSTASVEELKRALPAADCSFALLRLIDQIDQSSTVKFVYIRCQPDAASAMKKSEVSTKLGLYAEVFAPFSTEIFITAPDDISQESVVDKVASASGSKSKVVASKA